MLLFYYFISIGFQAEVFASRVAKPECRTTIFTGRPAVFASRVAKPECRTTISTGRPAVFASRAAKPECRTTIFTGGPDRLLSYYFTISFPLGSRQEVILHLGQHFLHVSSRFCMSAKRIPPPTWCNNPAGQGWCCFEGFRGSERDGRNPKHALKPEHPRYLPKPEHPQFLKHGSP